MTVIRVAPSPRRHTTPDEKFLQPKCRSEIGEKAAFLHKFEATRSLPIVDLRHTLSHRWLGTHRNLRLLRWMKSNFGLLHSGQILGTLLTLVVIAAPRNVGQVLGPISAALSLVSVVCSILTASLDVLRLLTRHFEYWFFSMANLVAWALLAFFLEDPFRVVSLIPLWLSLQLAISMDTNFRTFVIALRSNMLMLGVLMVTGTLVFLQVIVADESQVETELPLPFAVEDVTLPLVGIFENALATLIPFLIRGIYTKRKLFAARCAGSKLVRCELYRAQLVLRPVRYSRTASLGVETSSRNYVLQKHLGITAPVMSIASANDTAQHHQQITLVALRLSAIDSRNTVLPSWPVQTPGQFSISKLLGVYGVGSAGLALTVATLALPPGRTRSTVEYMTPVLGFVLSVAFCSAFACASQRDMLRALLFHNFGFFFSMMHCSVACLSVADMMNWDYRCWAVASAFLWFVWMQLLDAVTPPVRRQLRFSKVQVVPVLWLLWGLMFTVAYAIVFLHTENSGLQGRDLFHFHVGHNVTVLNTKNILLNRLFIMFFWMQRHAWNIIRGAFMRCWRSVRSLKVPANSGEEVVDPDEEELSIMRGSLEYFCPFETFPGTRRRISGLQKHSSSMGSRRRTSLTGRHHVRRLSSEVLLTGVILPTAEQQRKTRRKAFGQRSCSSQTENDNHTSLPDREKTNPWADLLPGSIRDE